jgi:hypothetical protein
MGYMMDSIASGMNKENLPVTDKILFLYLLHNDHSFYRLVSAKLKYFSSGNTLAEPPQYDKHEYVFKFVFEVSSACSAVFRD